MHLFNRTCLLSINFIFRTLFAEIIYIIDKRLNDHGKNWRHVYKALLILEHGICCGPESMVHYAKDAIYVIKTLKEFQFLDDHGRDNGAMVRAKSREIVALLENESLLIEARNIKSMPLSSVDRSSPKPLIAPSSNRNGANASSNSHSNNRKRSSFEDLQNLEEEEALNKALEESKREYEQRNQVTETTISRTGSLLDLSEDPFNDKGATDKGSGTTLSNAVLNMQYYQEHRSSMPVIYPPHSHSQMIMTQPMQIYQHQHQFPLLSYQNQNQSPSQQSSVGLLLHHASHSPSSQFSEREGLNSNPPLHLNNRTYSVDSGMQIKSPPLDPFQNIASDARKLSSSYQQSSNMKNKKMDSNPFYDITSSFPPSHNSNSINQNPFQTLNNPFGDDEDGGEAVFIPLPNSSFASSAMNNVGNNNIGAKPVLPSSSNQFFADLSRESNSSTFSPNTTPLNSNSNSNSNFNIHTINGNRNNNAAHR